MNPNIIDWMRYRKNAASKYQNSSQRHIYSHAFFYFFCWMGLLFSPHFKMKMWIHCLYIKQIAKDMKQFIKVLQMSWFFLCFRLFFTYYDVVRHCYMKNNSRRKLLVWSTSWKLWREKKRLRAQTYLYDIWIIHCRCESGGTP